MTGRKLSVLVNDIIIGSVTQNARGQFAFTYTDDWIANPSAIALSLSMPLTNARLCRQCDPPLHVGAFTGQ